MKVSKLSCKVESLVLRNVDDREVAEAVLLPSAPDKTPIRAVRVEVGGDTPMSAFKIGARVTVSLGG